MTGGRKGLIPLTFLRLNVGATLGGLTSGGECARVFLMPLPNLRRRRVEQGETLSDFSRASGLSLIYISQLERGLALRPDLPKESPRGRAGTMAKLAKLAECYGVKLPSLLRCMRKG